MSQNPYKLQQKVSGSFEIPKGECDFLRGNPEGISWRHCEEIFDDVLTLDEIAEQMKQLHPNQDDGELIRINYESDLWGVIFETGNYLGSYGEWIVHGVTKGYA